MTRETRKWTIRTNVEVEGSRALRHSNLMVLLVTTSLLHGLEQGFLVREVFEQKRFRHRRRISQLAGGGPIETLLGKNSADSLEDGRPPFFAR